MNNPYLLVQFGSSRSGFPVPFAVGSDEMSPKACHPAQGCWTRRKHTGAASFEGLMHLGFVKEGMEIVMALFACQVASSSAVCSNDS